MAKKSEEANQTDPNELINSAIEYGLNVLLERHPTLSQEYIQKHINRRKLTEGIREIYGELKKHDLSGEKISKYLYTEIANYVATGRAFDERGKFVVLKGGLEEKAEEGNFISRWFARRELGKEGDFEQSVEASHDLYSLLKTGDYAKRMPKLTQAIGTLYDMGFLNSALDNLKVYGLIDDERYKVIKSVIRERAKENKERMVKGVERLAIKGVEEQEVYQKAAAILVGSIGALMVFTSSNMTGGVIGALGSNGIKIVGAILFFIALILFLTINKKKRKMISRRKKKSKTFKNR